MTVETDRRFPLDLTVLASDGSQVTVADLRGEARAVAMYFMRTGTCPVCLHHARALVRQDLLALDVQPVVVVPGPPEHSARVRRLVGDQATVVSSSGAQAHQGGWLPPDPAPAAQWSRARGRRRRGAVPPGERAAHRKLRRTGVTGRDRAAVGGGR